MSFGRSISKHNDSDAVADQEDTARQTRNVARRASAELPDAKGWRQDSQNALAKRLYPLFLFYLALGIVGILGVGDFVPPLQYGESFVKTAGIVVSLVLGVMASHIAIQNARLQVDAGKELEDLRGMHAECLQERKAELDETQAERAARRDYEYDARRRLYEQCEPLIFQFVEFSQNAFFRIESLARSARNGDLPKWAMNNPYYIDSTMYNLLAPVVVYKLIQRRLTLIDLQLDSNIGDYYELGKKLSWSFTDDYHCSRAFGAYSLDYNPNIPDWEARRKSDPQRFWRQGLPIGRLDNAVEALIVREEGGRERPISFGEFETGRYKRGSRIAETFEFVHDVFYGFHPQARPVLWRLLIAQAHIYKAILDFHEGRADGRQLRVHPIAPKDRGRLYWIGSPTPEEQEQMDQPFSVAVAYLKERLGNIFKDSAE